MRIKSILVNRADSEADAVEDTRPTILMLEFGEETRFTTKIFGRRHINTMILKSRRASNCRKSGNIITGSRRVAIRELNPLQKRPGRTCGMAIPTAKKVKQVLLPVFLITLELGQPQIGVSPFSESGRFVITGESKINTHKKKSRYQFGGVTRVEDVSAQDSHQTIARSLQVQAPPKPIPHYIFTDFVENSRNTNQLLNEFCQFQRKSLVFLDVAAKESYKNYSIMASVDGFDYAPAEAWKKKIAKEAASRNALKRLLIEYYGDMGDLPKVEQLKNMKEGDEKISRDQDHPTRYRPMPRIGMNELGLGLITLYPEPHEGGHGDTESNLIIGSVWEKMAELRMDRDGFKDDIVAVVIRWSGVFAARDPLVVSIATGSPMKEATDFKEEHRDLAGKWGRVLQDTSPWSLARRGLKRYLLHEASKFYTLQYENKFDEYFSIFEIPANNSSSQVLALKEGIEFVYFATSKSISFNKENIIIVIV